MSRFHGWVRSEIASLPHCSHHRPPPLLVHIFTNCCGIDFGLYCLIDWTELPHVFLHFAAILSLQDWSLWAVVCVGLLTLNFVSDMLGSRTKHVFAYGRRGHRVVNAYDDYDRTSKDSDSSSTKRENDVPRSHLSEKGMKQSPISIKSCSSVQDSPLIPVKKPKRSPKVAKVGVTSAKHKPILRYPLGSIATNAPASPAIPPAVRAKRRQTVAKTSSLIPQSPIVDVDIVVLDAHGRRVSQEHRTARVDVQANVLAPAPSKRAKMLPRGAKSGTANKKSEPIVVSSDSE